MINLFLIINSLFCVLIILGLYRIYKYNYNYKYIILLGFIFNFYSYSWLYTALPLGWTNIYTEFALITLILILIGIIGSILYVLPYKFLIKYNNIYFISVAYTLVDIINSYAITYLFTYNPYIIANNFSTFTLGNAISSTALVSLSYIAYSYGLSFVALILIGSLYNRKLRDIAFVLCFITILYIYINNLPHSTPSLTITAVNTNYKHSINSSDDMYKLILDRNESIYQNLNLKAKIDSYHVLLLPEDIRHYDYLNFNNYKYDNFDLMIDGTVLKLSNGLTNTSVFYDLKGNTITARNKQALFPFSEYIPFAFDFILRHAVSNEDYDKKLNTKFALTDNHPDTSFNNILFLTTICSENLSYSIMSSLRNKIVDNNYIYISQGNLQIFKENPFYFAMALNSLRINSAYLRSVSVSVANSGGLIINNYNGETLYVLNPDDNIKDIHIVDGELIDIK